MPDYTDDLIEGQRRASEGLLDAAEDNEALVPVVQDLAGTLHRVAGNDRLWTDLAESSATDLDRKQLSQLVLVDWQVFLEQVGVEDAAELADELISAVAEAPGEPGAWGEVREAISVLANRLEDDVEQADGKKGPRRWRAVRDRAAHGVSVLRRVSRAKLVAEVGRSVSDMALPLFAGAIVVAGPLAPPAAFIAAGVGGLAWGAAGELRRCLDEERLDRDGAHLERLFKDSAAQRAQVEQRMAHLSTLEEIAAGGAVERASEILISLRSWAAHIGARLAAAWPFVAAQIGRAGIDDLERATHELADLRLALRDIGGALTARVARELSRATDAARAALERVELTLRMLEQLLGARGFGAIS